MRRSVLRVGLQPSVRTDEGQKVEPAAALLPLHATESQAWAALGNRTDVAVLVIADASRSFCAFDKPAENVAFDAAMRRVRTEHS